MDKKLKEVLYQPVSPYLLRPLRELDNARLESLVRKSRADAWARGADARAIREESLRAVQSAFPEMSPTAVSAAVAQLRETGWLRPPPHATSSPGHRRASMLRDQQTDDPGEGPPHQDNR